MPKKMVFFNKIWSILLVLVLCTNPFFAQKSKPTVVINNTHRELKYFEAIKNIELTALQKGIIFLKKIQTDSAVTNYKKENVYNLTFGKGEALTFDIPGGHAISFTLYTKINKL
jgi:hypothetical protein